MELDLHYFRHNKTDNAAPIGRGVIPYYDLTLVLGGSLDYVAGKRKVRVGERQAVLFAPGTIRERKATHGKTEYISFNFFCNDVIDLPMYIDHFSVSEVSSLISVCDSFGNIFEEVQKEILQNILGALILMLKRNLDIKKMSKITQEMIFFIQSHYKERLSMDDICKQVSYSAPHCSKVFSRDTGKSVFEYIITLKIEKAKSLLVENELSLTEIASYVGYDDYNYFTHLFKKRTGVSPLNYLKNLQNKRNDYL